MILFPNAKINLGLNVLRKRPDGYHDIVTVMVPVKWRDILEIVPSKSGKTSLQTFGRGVDCPAEKNLVMKAYNALSTFMGGLPPVEIYLEKIIPDGAGLGGGSSDAAFTIKGLNEIFNLGLPTEILATIAATVGADCPFFIYNRPALCEGIGDQITILNEDILKDCSILIAKNSSTSVSTAEAYAGIVPSEENEDIPSILKRDINEWQSRLVNDFEKSVFAKAPEIKELKDFMISEGAEYAAMSGSGASVFGIFKDVNMAHMANDKLSDCDKIVTSILNE